MRQRIKNFTPAPAISPARALSLHKNPVFRAMLNKPMSAQKQTNIALAARVAFESVQSGTGTPADRATLVQMVNVHDVLCAKHCAQADQAEAKAALTALVRADARAAQGKPWNFDGPGRAAMLAVLTAHEQMLAGAAAGYFTDAILIVDAMQRAGDVVQTVLEAGCST